MPVAIEIHGIDEIVRKLGRATALQVLEPPMQRSVLRLQRDMASNSDAPPMAYPHYRGIENSSYRRTGTLGRKWTVKVVRNANGLEGRVGNNTWYAPLVQSQRFQTRLHQRHGWITDTQAMNRNEATIRADFETAIRRAIA